MLSSMGISAGRFGCSALVIFAKPTPRMSANASKSCRIGSQGTESASPGSETPGVIAPRACSIAPRRSRIAAISAAEIRAPPRLASLRSGSPNDIGCAGAPKSKRQRARKPSTTLSGSSTTTPPRRTTGQDEVVVTRSA
jgi:hypothetical protein